jgi:hypothetical protein
MTFRRQGCSCAHPSEYNRQENPEYDRHEPGCDLAPDLAGMLWYPHGGEIENGGVYVDPDDSSYVLLQTRQYLCRAPRRPR